ncbi:hypothetical protein PTTG_12428 [Puccinia triticina 1-1 BBBD Race 1]|uniref:Secreted protein n=1 Tax=Puccinia triticina (isolate 1-1 / race 1 (BBBD)) TaxID=630390 RepID=A0A180G9I6_PUCT1|nr:hypothetical protein PTTG_12428 [Puccinia triticina 1-1 BBBD Race 1]
MRFSGLLALVALLYIQSGVAYAKFLCNDKAKANINKNTPVCMVKPSEQANKYYWTATSATVSDGASHTCEGVKIFELSTDARFCCDVDLKKKQDFTQADLGTLCYPRDAQKPKKKLAP